jgi:biotin carboxyl carrier protein
MKYFLKSSAGGSFEVEITARDDGRWTVRCGDREQVADFRDVDRLGQYAAVLDGRAYASFTLEALDERERAAGELVKDRPARAEEVRAPMPGILVAWRAEVGARIAPGGAIAVLEAMKMQNEVCSEHGGVLAELCAEPGKPVEAGQVLARLSPPA